MPLNHPFSPNGRGCSESDNSFDRSATYICRRIWRWEEKAIVLRKLTGAGDFDKMKAGDASSVIIAVHPQLKKTVLTPHTEGGTPSRIISSDFLHTTTYVSLLHSFWTNLIGHATSSTAAKGPNFHDFKYNYGYSGFPLPCILPYSRILCWFAFVGHIFEGQPSAA